MGQYQVAMVHYSNGPVHIVNGLGVNWARIRDLVNVRD